MSGKRSGVLVLALWILFSVLLFLKFGATVALIVSPLAGTLAVVVGSVFRPNRRYFGDGPLEGGRALIEIDLDRGKDGKQSRDEGPEPEKEA